MGKIEEYTERIVQLKAVRKTDESEIQSKIDATQAILDSANKAAAAAYNSIDIDTYCTAQEDARRASDTIGMYQKRLQTLSKMPLISEDEYKECVEEIRKEQLEAEKAARRDLVSLINQAVAIRDTDISFLNSADKVLKLLHEARTGSGKDAPSFSYNHDYMVGPAVARMTRLALYADSQAVE